MKKILMSLLILFIGIPTVNAENLNFAENAKSAILMEASTGKIIYAKNEHEKYSPASMTKMMTLLLIMESIDKDIIKWDEMVTVSANASSMGGSQILLETGEKMSVKDLVKGIAIASGNDAAVALAEKIAGSETQFVSMMNQRSKELGLKNTNFKNTHGLDEANHYSSAYDMAMISKELVKYPELLKISSIYETYLRENTDRAVWLVNTNKLVRFYEGVDGLKTGFTSTAGYCLTATAIRNNMRVIAVIMGAPTSQVRNSEISEMLDYMFAQYSTETLLSNTSVVKKIKIERAKKEEVNLIPKESVTALNKKTDSKKNITYNIEVDKIKKLPIKPGDIIGKIEILENNKVTRTIDLTVNKIVERANIFQLYWRNLTKTLKGT